MAQKPAPTWASYRDSIGDRSSLFSAITDQWPVERALYPGCYLDLSPSTAIHDVTYVDNDRRAATYFATPGLPESEAARARGDQTRGEGASAIEAPRITFHPADYTSPLPVPPHSTELLISLYAGPVWDNCRQYLAPRGLLLANTSHGDGSIAALEPDLELVAAVHHSGDRYRLRLTDLQSYLIPKSGAAPDVDTIRRNGRGIPYTRAAFAYIFRATS